MPRREVILVTGASGFLAAWVLQSLAGAGHSIIATDLACSKARLKLVLGGTSELPGLRWVACDITNGAQLSALVRDVQPSVILHLAALQIPACRANPVLGGEVNMIGHIRVLEAARAVGARVVYTSSIAAKPRGPDNAPANLYGVFKKSCEEISRLYAADFGVASLGLRPHVVYGVGRDQGETSAITSAMRAAALGEAYVIPWRTATCFQFAGDVAEIFASCCAATWQGALLSDVSDTVETTEDVIAAIKAVVPGADVRTEGPERLSPTAGFETAVLRNLLSEVPQTPLASGVQSTVTHFRRLLHLGILAP